MDFSNWIFWIVVVPSIALLWVTCNCISGDFRREQISKWGITFLSLSLLGIVSIETLLIFLFVTLAAYAVCCLFEQSSQKRKTIALTILIPVLLLPLLYYKYADFIAAELTGRQWDTFQDLIIPIGISFYSFQVISFCIDTLRRNQKVPEFVDYMNFCSFFPQIVAGPIERRDNLLPQMEAWRCKFNSQNMAEGVPYIVLGLFFKLVLADNLAAAMSVGYAGDQALQIWVNNVAFGFRIYFDFAGYGLSAYGVARCMGVKITMNFLSPYTCTNVTEFWRRWHVSLTLWFRDYIYFFMGGSRTKWWWFNILFMFLVSGFWHGAGWNFIIWGGLAGVTMIIHRLFRKNGKSLPGFIGWSLMFVTIMFIWMFFYETDMNVVKKNCCVIMDWENYDLERFVQEMKVDMRRTAMLCVFFLLSGITLLIEYLSVRRTPDSPYRLFISPVGCGVMTFLMVVLHNSIQNAFIYFAF